MDSQGSYQLQGKEAPFQLHFSPETTKKESLTEVTFSPTSFSVVTTDLFHVVESPKSRKVKRNEKARDLAKFLSASMPNMSSPAQQARKTCGNPGRSKSAIVSRNDFSELPGFEERELSDFLGSSSLDLTRSLPDLGLHRSIGEMMGNSMTSSANERIDPFRLDGTRTVATAPSSIGRRSLPVDGCSDVTHKSSRSGSLKRGSRRRNRTKTGRRADGLDGLSKSLSCITAGSLLEDRSLQQNFPHKRDFHRSWNGNTVMNIPKKYFDEKDRRASLGEVSAPPPPVVEKPKQRKPVRRTKSHQERKPRSKNYALEFVTPSRSKRSINDSAVRSGLMEQVSAGDLMFTSPQGKNLQRQISGHSAFSQKSSGESQGAVGRTQKLRKLRSHKSEGRKSADKPRSRLDHSDEQSLRADELFPELKRTPQELKKTASRRETSRKLSPRKPHRQRSSRRTKSSSGDEDFGRTATGKHRRSERSSTTRSTSKHRRRATRVEDDDEDDSISSFSVKLPVPGRPLSMLAFSSAENSVQIEQPADIDVVLDDQSIVSHMTDITQSSDVQDDAEEEASSQSKEKSTKKAKKIKHNVYTEVKSMLQSLAAARRQVTLSRSNTPDVVSPPQDEELGALETVVVQGLWSADAQDVKLALMELNTLLAEDDDTNGMARDFFNIGGSSILLGALRKWYEIAELQLEGFRILIAAIKASDEASPICVRCGALETTVLAMNNFPSDLALQEQACALLALLVPTKCSSETLARFVRIEGLPCLRRISERHSSSLVVQERICSILSTVSLVENYHEALQHNLEPVRTALDLHASESDLTAQSLQYKGGVLLDRVSEP